MKEEKKKFSATETPASLEESAEITTGETSKQGLPAETETSEMSETERTKSGRNSAEIENGVVEGGREPESSGTKGDPSEKKAGFGRKAGGAVLGAVKSVGQWIKRAFFGASKEISDEEKFAVEKIESPTRMMVKTFFSRKLAVSSLILLVALFLFVFIGPAFIPLDINYTDSLQSNIGPTYSLRSVPKKLKGNVESISGFSQFTVGVSGDGELFIWGETKDRLLGIDYKDVPDEVKNEKVAFAAAGSDHIIAITESGKVVGWGNKNSGQYGGEEVLNALPMPQELVNGTIDANEVKELVCGYQASAIVMKDGSVYAWGNKNIVLNLADVAAMTNVEKIVFSNSNAVALLKDGTITTGNTVYYTSVVSSLGNAASSLQSYLSGKKVLDLAASNYCIALLLEGGETVMSGVFRNEEDVMPALDEGEYFVKVAAGTRHFVGITNQGRAYGWGHNAYKQADLGGYEGAANVYAGSLQTYLTDENGNLVHSCGLKGYLMGTDSMGRDVFARIVHGGKMTMTIGAVAVVISTVIAVLIGCISGYFGGWVDMLLMRITEIFGAIPFLPFAMLLSAVVSNYGISPTMRIFMIMVILGALSWTGLARMIRGQVLAEREKEFVTAAKAMGVKENKIAFKHILPNIISVILVSVTLDFAGCLLTESSLSYLGFGVQQPQPTWGNMLNGANNSVVIQNYWWQWLFPALFLMLATICINVIGDTLRDVMDPKSSLER